MKTLEETLNKYRTSELNLYSEAEATQAMKEYATEYAKEALKNASDNATYILDANDEVHIIKSSILSESNLPKHR